MWFKILKGIRNLGYTITLSGWLADGWQVSIIKVHTEEMYTGQDRRLFSALAKATQGSEELKELVTKLAKETGRQTNEVKRNASRKNGQLGGRKPIHG